MRFCGFIITPQNGKTTEVIESHGQIRFDGKRSVKGSFSKTELTV